MIGQVLVLLAATSITVYAETAICEQLIECLAKARAKNDECLSSHASMSLRDSKHECRNETLHNQLKQLIEERTAHYETCLRAKAPAATPIENAKKNPLGNVRSWQSTEPNHIRSVINESARLESGRVDPQWMSPEKTHMGITHIWKKAKCEAIMRKHPVKRNFPVDERKGRRSIKKDKKRGQAAQKSCFREARKIKLQCSQLAKCCSISRQCRDTSAVDQKITEKKAEIRESQRQCRSDSIGRKGSKKHKQQQHVQSRRSKLPATTTHKP